MVNWSGALLLLVVYGIFAGLSYHVDAQAFVLLMIAGGVAFVLSE